MGEAPGAGPHLVVLQGGCGTSSETGSQPPQHPLVSCAALGQFPSLIWVSPPVRWGQGSPLPAAVFEVHSMDVSTRGLA